MYLNQATIIGNLTRDPELKALPSGSNICNFSIATNKTWIDKTSGEKKESVEYHNIVVFGKQAETSAQYLKKGSSALVIGELTTQSWEDKDSGKKMYKTEIKANTIQFGSKASMQVAPGVVTTPNGKQVPVSTQTTHEQQMDKAGIKYPTDDINPEDIPF